MATFARLGATLKDLGRLRVILQILVKHGFGLVIDQLKLTSYLPARVRTPDRDRLKLSVPERVRSMLEELGPVYIKFGQTLSMRPDLVPPEFIRELSKLQDRVPPFPREAVRQVVEEELGAPPEKFFREFHWQPAASASIAQVHRAVTRDGREVAVKLQRPGLKKVLDSDLEILRLLARLWESVNHQELPRRPVEFVDDFDRLMREELDFEIEGRHVELLQKNFRKRPGYAFPRVYWDLTTTRCLTQEYIHGHSLTRLPANLTAAAKNRLAQLLVDAYIRMSLEDHFFHADPHPGNLILDRRQRLVFLDAGQVGRLDENTVAAFTEMLLALVRQDTDAVVDAYLALGIAEGEIDTGRLKKDVALFLERYYSQPVEKLSFGQSLQELISISLKYHMRLPADFVVLGKTYLGAESLARRLNPKLNLVEAARPTAERIMRQRYSPRHLLDIFRHQLNTLRRFVVGLPAQLSDLLTKLQHGRLKIEFEHKGLEDLQLHIERASSRMSFALIVAALIIASSQLLVSHVGPSWGDFSILGLLGYMIAGLFGILLILSILRSGRM